MNEDKAHNPIQTKIAIKPPLEPVTLLAVLIKVISFSQKLILLTLFISDV